MAVLLQTRTDKPMDTMATDPLLSSDETLAQQVRDGDHQAFTELVRRHARRFHGLAQGLLKDSEEAEDMVQTAFLKFWKQPWQFDPDRNTRFTTWFYRVVLNQCLDVKKKKRELFPEKVPEITMAPKTDDQLEEAEKKRWLKNAALSLPESQQVALRLCFYEGLSNEAAAEIMGIKLKALQSLLVRARKKLTSQLPAKFLENKS